MNNFFIPAPQFVYHKNQFYFFRMFDFPLKNGTHTYVLPSYHGEGLSGRLHVHEFLDPSPVFESRRLKKGFPRWVGYYSQAVRTDTQEGSRTLNGWPTGTDLYGFENVMGTLKGLSILKSPPVRAVLHVPEEDELATDQARFWCQANAQNPDSWAFNGDFVNGLIAQDFIDFPPFEELATVAWGAVWYYPDGVVVGFYDTDPKPMPCRFVALHKHEISFWCDNNYPQVSSKCTYIASNSPSEGPAPLEDENRAISYCDLVQSHGREAGVLHPFTIFKARPGFAIVDAFSLIPSRSTSDGFYLYYVPRFTRLQCYIGHSFFVIDSQPETMRYTQKVLFECRRKGLKYTGLLRRLLSLPPEVQEIILAALGTCTIKEVRALNADGSLARKATRSVKVKHMWQDDRLSNYNSKHPQPTDLTAHFTHDCCHNVSQYQLARPDRAVEFYPIGREYKDAPVRNDPRNTSRHLVTGRFGSHPCVNTSARSRVCKPLCCAFHGSATGGKK